MKDQWYTLFNMDPKRTLAAVLGAGASRDVLYNAGRMPIESPLDSDFFDLLQRLELRHEDQDAIVSTLGLVRELPYDCWRSVEKAFYTLHLKAEMQSLLAPGAHAKTPDDVVRLFVRSFQALLHAAHEDRFCVHHRELVQRFWRDDAILSFNYDLVIERALNHLAEDLKQQPCVEAWLYGLGRQPDDVRIPTVFKLHGSSNWVVDSAGTVSIMSLKEPQSYAPSSCSTPPILLPFWDKPVNQQPWVDLWKKAYSHLNIAQDLLVWGYSLPATDVRSQCLFKLANESRTIENLCVIDPSEGTQRRWRELFPHAKYWQFRSFNEFRQNPPNWWKERPENCIS